MAKFELDQAVTGSIDKINNASSHHQSPAGALGMNRIEIPSNILEARLRKRELPDGSLLAPLDYLLKAKLRELPRGSIVGFGNIGQMQFDRLNEHDVDLFLAREFIGIIADHTTHQTVLYGLMRSPRAGEAKQGRWGTYVDDLGNTYRELDDAMTSLQRLFHPTQGVEPWQILSATINQQQLYASDQSLGSVGCGSHNSPKKELPRNALTEPFVFTPPFIIDLDQKDTPGFVLHLGIDPATGGLVPLKSNSDPLLRQESHSNAFVLIAQAQKIARENPTNMGSGTEDVRVFNAILETTSALADLTGNGAPVSEAQRVFKQHLGVRG